MCVYARLDSKPPEILVQPQAAHGYIRMRYPQNR